MQTEVGTERVTVTLPVDDARRLRQLAEAGDVKSVSAFVAAAVRDRLARDESLHRLDELWGRLPEGALAQARETFGVAAGPSARAS
ncbi:MAG TPA: ribbon-helix-helix domain-containing protein [Mycobacteriales bacterium]|nr:ribbon-helix-helix domain-containing protein [Mycobacteriales bacterium]